MSMRKLNRSLRSNPIRNGMFTLDSIFIHIPTTTRIRITTLVIIVFTATIRISVVGGNEGACPVCCDTSLIEKSLISKENVDK